MLSFYQNLPNYINPIAFELGNFEIRWYALMYLVAFAVVYFLLMYRIKRQEFSIFNFQFSNKSQLSNFQFKNLILDFLLYAMAGLLIGGRLGYVLFYNLQYYSAHLLEALLPIKITSYGLLVTGYYGMSYFGGVLGIMLAGIIFCKKYRVNFWQLADFVVPAIPAGYFFGRLGNFLNGELIGRVTDKPWGMYFADGVLRHPSQLYEAFFEGLVLFAILWVARNKKTSQMSSAAADNGQWSKLDGRMSNVNGQLLIVYLFLYAFFRFFIEFFREPDSQVGFFLGWLTLGQILSLGVMILTVALIFYRRKKLSTAIN